MARGAFPKGHLKTDTTEAGLERLICTALAESACEPAEAAADAVRERPAAYAAGWICGAPEHTIASTSLQRFSALCGDILNPQLRRTSSFAFYNTSRYDFEKLLADLHRSPKTSATTSRA